MAENQTAEKAGAVISSSACGRYFGFLGGQPKGTKFPDECLTCSKMLECMTAKPEVRAKTPPKKKPQKPHPKKKRAFSAKLKRQTVQRAAEMDEESPDETFDSPPRRLEDEFVVVTAGMLFDNWSNTVLINRATVEQWGKRWKEIEITTGTGRKTKCKVLPVQDVAKGLIHVPDKLRLNLGIREGAVVKVKLIVK